MQPMLASNVGDFEGDGLDDLGLLCPQQPGVTDPGADNTADIGWNLMLSSDFASIPGEHGLVASRSVYRDVGEDYLAQPQRFAALGDLDGDGLGEIGVVAWSESSGEVLGHVLRGTIEPEPSFGLADDYTPFLLAGDYTDSGGLEMAAAGLLPGRNEPGLWIRWGEPGSARIGFLSALDSASWTDVAVPDVAYVFAPPGAASPLESRRFALGGAGDADGDGVLDLLIFGGHDEGGCSPETCGAFWLILCGDADGDGSSACAGDCDDADPTRFASAVELCDSIDHDCDGSDGQEDADGDGVALCEGDCDDSDPARAPGLLETCADDLDIDCDGLVPFEDVDADGSTNCEDCQPWNAAAFPGAAEICDGFDNDCDGVLPTEETDFDGDGWLACSQGGLRVDCDDYAPFVHPGRFEDCEDEIDNDCDGAVDEDEDADGDGVRSCDGDCDDTRADTFPGAEELCDGLDHNCDGLRDNGRDDDGDGSSLCDGDCDDTNASVHPGAPGDCSGEVDANCDGASDLSDADGDGWSACGGDCDDTSPGVSPVATEYCDRLDNDCSGAADEVFDQDGDGWASCLGDCSDSDALRFPAAVEPDCTDGIDGDCDLAGDASDSDCFVPEEEIESDPRPYGVSCEGCSASVAYSAADRRLAWLLLFGIAAIWRRRRPPVARPGGLAGGVGPRGLTQVALPLLVLGLWVVPAHAAKKEPVLVIYLADQPDMQGMIAARELLPRLDAVEILHSSELLPESGDRILAVGIPRAHSCPVGGNPPQLVDSAGRVLDRLIQLDYRGALRIYQHVIRELPCLNVPLAQGVLADLLYYRGMAQLGLDYRPEAEEAFRHTLGMKPDYQGDPNFPPESNAVLEAVRREHRTWPWVRMSGYAGAGAILRVDGSDWDPASESLDLHPGMHVVQYRRRGRTWTLVINLREGDTPFLIYSGDRLAALEGAQRNTSARKWSGQLLGLEALDQGADLVAVVDLQRSPDRVLYFYRVGSDEFSFSPRMEARTSAGRQRIAERQRSDQAPVSPRAVARKAEPSSGRRGDVPGRGYSDRLRLRFAGGYAYVKPFSYALLSLDASIRLVAGLGVDLGGEVGVNRSDSWGVTLLPAGQIGLSYRFEVGAFQPRIGALVRLGADSALSADGAPSLRFGWAGRVGFDLIPGGGAGLLSLDAQVGMYGKPLFVSVTGAGGFRF
jgi:MYXO-CTERM domain-containing protein